MVYIEMVKFNLGKALFSVVGTLGISFSVIYFNQQAIEVIKALIRAPFEDDEKEIYVTDDEEETEKIDQKFNKIFEKFDEQK